MPLLDHFHPPLSTRRHWHSFHNAWATYLSADLNKRLPQGYFAEANVQFGLEVDVAMFQDEAEQPNTLEAVGEPTFKMPFSPPEDLVEIRVFGNEEGPILAGAIELVSPANKDRSEHRKAFADKCVYLLSSGAGVLIVDLVTSRKANLLAEIQKRLGNESPESHSQLYTSSLRPVIASSDSHIEVWESPLTVGSLLPEATLWLSGHWPIQIDLEGTYQRTIEEQRLPLVS